ncbi:hypothetical protein ACNKHV_20275 [Shigella flexneri]
MLQQAKPFVDERQSKTFWFDIATPTVLSARRFQAISPRRTATWAGSRILIKAYFNGTAGQSFGVWSAGGVGTVPDGDANDYVGKGMAGQLPIRSLRRSPPSAAMKQALSATPACMARPVVVCMPQAAR